VRSDECKKENAMKINDSIKKTVGLETEKISGTPGKKLEKASVEPQAAESVTLSPLSSELKNLEAKISATEVFDAKKVDSIKSAIASGKFKVDTEKVADGLVNTVKDLLGNKNP
jgi:negative regulator of flagellin synthesis FlgM